MQLPTLRQVNAALARLSLDEWQCFLDPDHPPPRHARLLNRALEDVEQGKIRRLMIFLPPGHAKALALDTPIPTPDGWKTMGELRAGDRVFDENGLPCNVVRVSEVWKDRPCYAVKTDCGDTIIADEDHEWRVTLCRKPRKPLLNNGKGRPGMVGRDDESTRFKIKTTLDLSKQRTKRPMIERAKALLLPDSALPVDPYVLGVWLGDGTSSQMSITSSVDDQGWMRQEIERIGYKTSNRSVPTLFGLLGARAEFVRLGLLNDPEHNTHGRKHIPARYMRSSIEQRKALLQGLIDTDGSVSPDGQVMFCNTNRELVDGVAELVRSLGAKATIIEGRAKLNGNDHGAYWRAGFYMSGAARMPRKAALCRDAVRTPHTYVEAVKAENRDTVCITVDSPSHLFLAGRSMTPTHNSSYASINFPAWYLGRNPAKTIIGCSHTDDLATAFGRRVRNIVKADEFSEVFGFGIDPGSTSAGEWAVDTPNRRPGQLAGVYKAAGVGGSITGRRGDLGLIDDPLKSREDAESKTIRAKQWEWYKSDFRTRLKPGAAIIIIQTRWHMDDLSGRILPEDYDGRTGKITARDGEVWHVLSMPAVIETAHQAKHDPLKRQIGDALWPEWYSAEHLRQEKISQGPRNWSALFQQHPVPDAGGYFQRDWFKWFDTAPSKMAIVGMSDYAVTKDGGDYTEHGVFGIDQYNRIHVLDWWSGQTTPEVWIDAKLDLVDKWKTSLWVGESGVIRRSIEGLLMRRMQERNVWTRMEWLAPIGDKEARARGFQARASGGFVLLPNGKAWATDLHEQLLMFPAGVYDDKVDVCSLLGRALDMTGFVSAPVDRKREGPKPFTEAWLESGDDPIKGARFR